MTKSPWYRSLYLQVLLAITLGALLGHFRPHLGEALKPLGEAFVRLIRMVIAPIVFCTVVGGIASMGDMKKVGRVGARALVYFEIVTTAALGIGLVVVEVLKPGAGINATLTANDTHAVEGYAGTARQLTTSEFLLNMVPSNVVDAFAKGEMLQVLVFSVLFGFALSSMGDTARELTSSIERLGKALFVVVGIVMKVAPLGAFGAMAFNVGKYGIHTLVHLGHLMVAFYLTSALFVMVVLGTILRVFTGLSIVRLLRYIREEIFVVLGTSSSESALPAILLRMEAAGCSRSVVGMVIPTGYSFNLDGTSIYLTMAAMFVAQATNTHLSLSEKLSILGVLLITSKGAAAVTGGGFITLAATLSSTGKIPVAGLALLLGIDRFMSEARAVTNLIGNCVATLVVARWEGELDHEKARAALQPNTH
jgi:aerobic C4-dicarboxylate transport protein